MKRTFAAAALLLTTLSGSLQAQDAPTPLFPTPLHLVREIEDPISGVTHSVEEYYTGNRVVTVSGDRVAIADYAEGTLTEIDRAAGTYSVASFEEIAEARRALGGPRPVDHERVETAQAKTVAPRPVAGRVAETLAAEFADGELRRVEVSLSPEIMLSTEAIEVITGAAFPNEPGRASIATVALTRRPDKGVRTASGAGGRHALPLRQILELEIDGEQLRVENRVVRVSGDLPPVELIAIPADARKVEPHLIQMRRLSEELDRLPGVKEKRQP